MRVTTFEQMTMREANIASLASVVVLVAMLFAIWLVFNCPVVNV
jgi:hypothetical protein